MVVCQVGWERGASRFNRGPVWLPGISSEDCGGPEDKKRAESLKARWMD